MKFETQMTCKDRENDYPGLHKVLHLASKDLDPDHPLFTSMHSDNSAIQEMLKHTDHCVERVLATTNQTWLKSKANKLMRDKTTANLSAILAEIRAYYALTQAWGTDQVSARPDEIQGSDFSINLENEVFVEVQAPDIAKNKYRMFEIRRWKGGVHCFQAASDPRKQKVGVPKRGIETNQGELAVKISRIKDKEEQFHDLNVSVLWLDFGDPTTWRRGIEIGQALPLIFGGNAITSGYLWYAFYADIDDPIFDAVAEHSPKSVFSKMDSAGRFNDDTKIDLVIVNTASYKVAFQNHNSKKKFPSRLFEGISRLPNISLEYSWLDWPTVGSLKPRIEESRQHIRKFASDFDSSDDVITRRRIMDKAIQEIDDAEKALGRENDS